MAKGLRGSVMGKVIQFRPAKKEPDFTKINNTVYADLKQSLLDAMAQYPELDIHNCEWDLDLHWHTVVDDS